MRQNYIKIYIIVILTIIAAISYLFIQVSNTKAELTLNIKNKFITDARNIACNFNKYVHYRIPGDLYNNIDDNKKLREDLNNVLSLFLSNNFKYIYVLYKDENNKYRYLLDGSILDRGEFKESLHVNKKKWNNVYKTKEHNVFVQDELDSLYGTYLYPIIYNNKTQAILAIDFSSKLPSTVSDIIKPVTYLFMYVVIANSIFMILLLWQTILYFSTKKKSVTDALTGLYNRTYLNDISTSINLNNYSFAMLDIDKFKNVNDTYGHEIGDLVLEQSSNVFKQSIRDHDILIRYGGEEFLLLIYTRSNEQVAKDISERIRMNIQKYDFVTPNEIINVTISIGVNLTPATAENFEKAVKIADENLYKSKHNGRNQVTAS